MIMIIIIMMMILINIINLIIIYPTVDYVGQARGWGYSLKRG